MNESIMIHRDDYMAIFISYLVSNRKVHIRPRLPPVSARGLIRKSRAEGPRADTGVEAEG